MNFEIIGQQTFRPIPPLLTVIYPYFCSNLLRKRHPKFRIMKSFNRTTALFAALFFPFSLLTAQSTTTGLIRVDQFGYQPGFNKVAVIADPQVGFNAAESYTPGPVLQVRLASNGQTVFSDSPTAWKNGATHDQSGDRGWWFDFSGVTEPGEYYIYDPANQVASYPFRIADDVYRDVLRQAVRMFFYQRIGMAKQPPYVDAKWADGAAFEGPNQDRGARSRWDKANPETARDLHGGWMDAGDVNKYTTFAESAVFQLLTAYSRNPNLFTDFFGIPESGNGIPDLLDDVMWELDWLMRMQDATGTGGLLLKLGVDNFEDVSPPSADTRPRYYLPECTSATLAGCAMFAKAGYVFRNAGIPALNDYADELILRARVAWERAKVSTVNFTFLETECDDGEIKSGYADRTEVEQIESAFTAAVYLYGITGLDEFRDFAEGRYNTIRPYLDNWWGPYRMVSSEALLDFSQMSGINPAIVSNIRLQKGNLNDAGFSVNQFNNQEDLYRSYMDDWAYHWGSNQVRANCGTINMDFIHYGINPNKKESYQLVAEQYLHYFHGVNALGLCMLTNMYAYGGDHCANEIYHTWFGDNTAWDNALTSPKGPPPGYLTGGPNKDFTLPDIVPPGGQPIQKSYKDWNTGWPENSWEITEPAIYYQAAYILLLSTLMPSDLVGSGPEPEAGFYFTAAPNPFRDRFEIRFDAPLSDGTWTVEVLDITGKAIATAAAEPGKPTEVVLPDNTPSGMFIAVLLRDGVPAGRQKVVRF